MTNQEVQNRYLSDISLWVLILGNITSIAMAVHQQWDMMMILWVYWAQSVTIGVVNVIRISNLKDFSTKNLRMNNQAVPETPKAKKQVASFFALHYGLFHLGYLVFLWQEQPLLNLEEKDIFILMMLIFSFIGAHGFSYRHNIDRDFKDQKPNLGTLMFYPYLRIIPMHLAIIFGMFSGTTMGLIIFMALKTLADGGMHIIEHRMFQKKLT